MAKKVKIKKAKKHHVALWVTLSIVFVLIILPIGLAYALFYDNSHAVLHNSDDIEISELANDMIASSLDNTAGGRDIRLNITRDNLNQLLYDATKNAPISYKTYCPQLYVDITATNYVFNLEVSVPMMATRIALYTELSEYTDPDNSENNAFVFKITDASVGRLHGLYGIAGSILKANFPAENLEKVFSDAGLHIDVDYSKDTFSYNHLVMLDDIANMMSGSGIGEMYYTVLRDFFTNELIDFTFYKNERISGIIDLERLHTNASYCSSEKELGIDLDSYRDKVVSLADSDIITRDKIQMIFSYMLYGYSDSPSETQTYVATLDLSSIGISDPTTYQGLPYIRGDDVTTIMKNKINPTDLATGLLGDINEDEINSILSCENIIGYSYVLTHFDAQGKFVINFITIDNFYTNIVDNELSLVVGLNFNGYETSIIIVTETKSCSDYTLTLKTKKILFGYDEVSDELQNYLFDIIESAIASESWISVDTATKEISISFKKAVEDSGYKTLIDSYGTVDISLVGTSIFSNGYLHATVS